MGIVAFKRPMSVFQMVIRSFAGFSSKPPALDCLATSLIRRAGSSPAERPEMDGPAPSSSRDLRSKLVRLCGLVLVPGLSGNVSSILSTKYYLKHELSISVNGSYRVLV